MALTAEQIAERRTYVGASEVAALFGVHPYHTKLELYLKKIGALDHVEDESSRPMKWGSRLEGAIAAGIAEDEGWKIRKVNRPVRHPAVPMMACLMDYEIVEHADGPAPFEIKNVNQWAERSGWVLDEEAEAPLYIELQLQHQLACTGRAWGAIGALRGGNEPVVIRRRRDENVILRIEQAVAAFAWQVQNRIEPPIEGAKDLETMKLLYPASVAGSAIDLSADASVLAAYRQYQQGSEQEKAARALKDGAKAAILQALGEHEVGLIGTVDGKTVEVCAPMRERAGYTVEPTTYRAFSFRTPKAAKKPRDAAVRTAA
jgi:putative phage-type endonuclease